jgi:hypothetical protein
MTGEACSEESPVLVQLHLSCAAAGAWLPIGKNFKALRSATSIKEEFQWTCRMNLRCCPGTFGFNSLLKKDFDLLLARFTLQVISGRDRDADEDQARRAAFL